ncbi:hypothetical protein [Paraburkholderia bannensis]|uniref:hypothetical protein n=1 Tax=Paraburkholderia bannensis TaxID=765414 RepID=UPI002AB6BD52|nr:hypothetical protein [Paraburkholderia bannensis]
MHTRFKIANLRPAVAGAALCALLAGCSEKPPAAAPLASADTPLLSVPIQRNGAWVIEAQDASNKTHRLLLDTGASFDVFEAQGPLAATPLTQDAEAAFLRQGVLTHPGADSGMTVNTLSNAHHTELGLRPALRAQGWTLPADTLALKDKFGRIALTGDTPFDGIIGVESMSKLTWRADYVAGKLTAYADAAPAHDWQQCTFMTRDLRARSPLIELGLANESNQFVLDTGFDADILLPQELFDNLEHAKQFAQVQTVFTTDITNQVIPRPEGLVAGFTIGQIAMPRLAVQGRGQDLRLGMGVLEKMDRFELDFRHYRFCFDLPSKPQDSTLTVVRSTLERQGDRYAIVTLAPDGRLAESGANMGDLIAQVDGTDVKALNLDQLSERLANPAPHEVTVQRGDRTLALKLR